MFDSLKCLFLEFFYLILVLLNLLRLHYINDLLNFWRWTTICLLEFFLEQVNDHLFSAVDRRKISYHDRVVWQGTSTFVVILLLFLYHVTDTNQGHKMNQEIYNLQKSYIGYPWIIERYIMKLVHYFPSDQRLSTLLPPYFVGLEPYFVGLEPYSVDLETYFVAGGWELCAYILNYGLTSECLRWIIQKLSDC